MQITKRLYISARPSYFGEEGTYNGFVFSVLDFDIAKTNKDRIAVSEFDLDVEIPLDFSPIAAQVASLKGERADLVTQQAIRLAQIDAKLAKLQCLELAA